MGLRIACGRVWRGRIPEGRQVGVHAGIACSWRRTAAARVVYRRGGVHPIVHVGYISLTAEVVVGMLQ